MRKTVCVSALHTCSLYTPQKHVYRTTSFVRWWAPLHFLNSVCSGSALLGHLRPHLLRLQSRGSARLSCVHFPVGLFDVRCCWDCGLLISEPCVWRFVICSLSSPPGPGSSTSKGFHLVAITFITFLTWRALLGSCPRGCLSGSLGGACDS